jgi:hypothetical protein
MARVNLTLEKGYSEGQNDENHLPEAGIDDIQPNDEESIITLWEWESGIPLPTTTTTTMEESPPSPMNTTTTTVPE